MTKTTELEPDEIDKARNYILFSIERLYTYENYVKTKLAGDFACEIAKTLKDQEEQIKALADELRGKELASCKNLLAERALLQESISDAVNDGLNNGDTCGDSVAAICMDIINMSGFLPQPPKED